jgi:transaldolase
MADADRAAVAREIALEGFEGPGTPVALSHPALAELRELGTELWIDTGDIEAARPLWRSEFTACTTNNTLANRVIQTGRMDEDIKDIVEKLRTKLPGGGEQELISEVTEVGFIVNCRIALSLVKEFGCKVSVELHPNMAHTVESSVLYGKRYYEVCPEFFYVKVPLTPAGYVAARHLSDANVPVNFTIAFSARQNYLAALLSRPAFTNVFLGRLNQVVKENGLGNGDYVGERATLAAQNAIQELRNGGAGSGTRLIAASMRSGQQVFDLAGVDVMTIPPKAVGEVYESTAGPELLNSRLQTEYEAGLNEGVERANILWVVSDRFKEYTKSLAAVDPAELTPGMLVEKAPEAGINFLRRFSEEEIARITEKGKMPNLADWPEDVALDDLMTESALHSFATDQRALDDRIKSFL